MYTHEFDEIEEDGGHVLLVNWPRINIFDDGDGHDSSPLLVLVALASLSVLLVSSFNVLFLSENLNFSAPGNFGGFMIKTNLKTFSLVCINRFQSNLVADGVLTFNELE